MPTFPIMNPKSFILDLLEYLKQAYRHFSSASKMNKQNKMPATGGILSPTLAPNHPQAKSKTFDDALNEYNRSKARNKIEISSTEPSKDTYDFVNNPKSVEHTIMVLQALISVIKSNPEVEIQCIGHFDMIFGFLANNLTSQVSFDQI